MNDFSAFDPSSEPAPRHEGKPSRVYAARLALATTAFLLRSFPADEPIDDEQTSKYFEHEHSFSALGSDDPPSANPPGGCLTAALPNDGVLFQWCAADGWPSLGDTS